MAAAKLILPQVSQTSYSDEEFIFKKVDEKSQPVKLCDELMKNSALNSG